MLRTSWSALAAKCCAFLLAVYMAGISPGVGAQAVAPVVGSQDERVTAWWETARPDHEKRKSRLLQLSQNQFVGSPEFYTDLVSRADLPQFPVDVPILRVVFPAKALFDFDKDRIRTDMAKVLDTVGQALRAEPHSLSVFVAGHTDGIGDEAYNLMLSVRRAENVARELNQRGVGNAGIWRIGFGKAVPLRPNTTDEKSRDQPARRVPYGCTTRGHRCLAIEAGGPDLQERQFRGDEVVQGGTQSFVEV